MIRSGIFALAFAAAVVGCSDKASTIDAPATVDSKTADAPRVADARPVDAPVTADARMASAQWVAVHNELKTYCVPCHGSAGGSGGHRMGQTDVIKAYMDSQLNSFACAGKTKGACAAVRILDGTMPQGNPLPMGERTRIAAIIDAWVTAGQP
jgi:cytochrome c553